MTAPGYVLDRTSHGIHIDPYDPAIEDDPVLTVTNLARPALRIIKYDRQSKEKLPNDTFEIYKDAELFDTRTTDESGEINLYELEPGTYLVKEVSTDSSHIVDTTPQQIELRASQTATQELVFFNDRLPGIHLIKVDSADLSKPIPNVKFRLEAVDGSWGPVEMTTLEGRPFTTAFVTGNHENYDSCPPKGFCVRPMVIGDKAVASLKHGVRQPRPAARGITPGVQAQDQHTPMANDFDCRADDVFQLLRQPSDQTQNVLYGVLLER